MRGLLTLLAAVTTTTSAVVFVDSTLSTIAGNWSIGYVNTSSTTQQYHKISMLKFPANVTGTAQSLTIMAIPGPQTETCQATIWLYSFATQTQIGNSILVAFTALGAGGNGSAAGGGPSSSSGLEYMSTIDISSTNWVLYAGVEYYFTIQTYTYDSVRACSYRVCAVCDYITCILWV